MPKFYKKLSLTCLLIASNIFANPQPNVVTNADIEKFATVLAQIQHYHINPTNPSTLFDNAIKGMLKELDPHSSYLNKDDFKMLNSHTTGNYAGIGIQIVEDKGLIKIISPFDDTPAAKAKLKPGDIILKVNNQFVRDIGVEKAVDLLVGKPGTKVSLIVYKKEHKKTEKISLTREIITLKSVTYKLMPKNIGYIRISVFGDNTSPETKKALKKLNKATNDKLNALILDLRNNPGGTLDSAVAISDLFLDSNKLDNKIIVRTSGREPSMNSVINATAGDAFKSKPIVVLINGGSASASEIVASALSEHNRAITLGTKTFGKGSIQTVIPVTSETAIKLTTGLYYTPRNNEIQAKGVSPDVSVPYTTIPKHKTDINDIFDESQFYNHLKSKPKSLNKTKLVKADSSSIAQTDFQLYQAIKLLHGLLAMQD